MSAAATFGAALPCDIVRCAPAPIWSKCAVAARVLVGTGVGGSARRYNLLIMGVKTDLGVVRDHRRDACRRLRGSKSVIGTMSIEIAPKTVKSKIWF